MRPRKEFAVLWSAEEMASHIIAKSVHLKAVRLTQSKITCKRLCKSGQTLLEGRLQARGNGLNEALGAEHGGVG